MIDSHCHLHWLKDKERAIEDAKLAGVFGFLSVSTDLKSSSILHIDNVVNSVGVHPNNTKMFAHIKSKDIIAKCINKDKDKIVAIGECGLDYYREHDKKQQERLFREHIEAALFMKLPIIIHSREAAEDTIRIIKDYPYLKGQIHCFDYDYHSAKRFLDLGFMLSISGIVTFNNSTRLRGLLTSMPLEHLLMETDSPFLTPEGICGKNEPKHIVKIVATVSKIMNKSYHEIVDINNRNFFKLFPDAEKWIIDIR